VELAVQDSPSNPPAAWLWKPKEQIIGKEVNIRVGGSFVWPPTWVDRGQVKNVVFIAGGVGIKYVNKTSPTIGANTIIAHSSLSSHTSIIKLRAHSP
jgi:hypothetical protein